MMDLGNIITNSFKYPFNDYKNLSIFCALFLLALIPFAGVLMEQDTVFVIGLITTIILMLIVPGYLLSVIHNGCEESLELPSLNIVKNIVNTLKLIVLDIVYMIIPVIVLLILLFATGFFTLFSANSIENLSELSLGAGFIAAFIIMFIVSLIFLILSYIAKARFAHTGSLSEALDFGKVIRDIKDIGVGKLVIWYLLMNVLVGLVSRITIFLLLIPYAGVLVYVCIITPVLMLIYYYSIGLLYSGICGLNIDEFEKELYTIRKQE